MYYILFDEQGNYVTTYIPKANCETPPAGTIETTEEDWQKYIENGGNKYRRGADGRPEEKPPYIPTLDERKTEKLNQINQWTATAITSGFISTCTGANVRFDSDKDTQITMQGIALNVNTPRFATEYPNGCPVRGYATGATEKTVFWLSSEQVLAFCADLSAHIGICKQKGWQLQRDVAAAASKEDLDLIV